MKLEKRPNYDCYVDYFWPRAKWLEENCLLGNLDYLGPEADKHINDPLMQNIPAYNCVSRTYEGFNNVNEDLNHKTNQVIFPKRPKDVQERVPEYVTEKWSLKEWIFAYYTHRSTGSGFFASKPFHGYHHSVVTHFGTVETIDEMCEMMIDRKKRGIPMFSTVGNQNPTPKKGTNLVEHITTFGAELCTDLAEYLEENHKSGNPPFSQKEITDLCNKRNIDNGIRRWNFPYAQMGADIATYHPELIDPNSSLYCGNNAVQAIDQMFIKPKGMDTVSFHDAALQDLTERLGTNASAHEDTLCIFIRFLNNLDRSGNGYKNASGYYMMDKDNKPMYPSIWRPEALERKLEKPSANLEGFFV